MTTSPHTVRDHLLVVLAAVAALAASVLVGVPAPAEAQTHLLAPEGTPRVLIYSATYGFRHPYIFEGNATMMAMGLSTGAYAADYTENPADLAGDNLANYDAVVFHSTAGKPPTLTDQIRDEFIRFMACGGGFVGLAMAADSNYAWPEYAELVGGNIVTHPLAEGHVPTRFVVDDPDHPINATFAGMDTADLWTQEELYTMRMDARRLPTVTPLLSHDTSSIPGSIQDGPDYYFDDEPIAWTNIFRGRGRSVYNGFGHGEHSWDHTWFREMVYDSIKWVLGPTGHPVGRDCAAGEGDVEPPAGPTPVTDPEVIESPCELPPTEGPDRGHYRDTLAVLTADGVTTTMPVGLPAYIFAPNLRYLLDLSAVGAASATVTVTTTWEGSADYDLGVTTPWGFAGSHRTPGQDLEVTTEQVVLPDVPHCTDFLVAAEHGASLGMFSVDFAPTLTVTVEPNG